MASGPQAEGTTGVGTEGRKATRRPRGQGSRQVRLNLALSDQEAELFKVRADAAGMSLSYWLVAAATAFANGERSFDARPAAERPAPALAEVEPAEATTASAKGPARKSGRVGCNACGRVFKLDSDGTLWPHRREDPQTGALVPCPGSGRPPGKVACS